VNSGLRIRIGIESGEGDQFGGGLCSASCTHPVKVFCQVSTEVQHRGKVRTSRMPNGRQKPRVSQ
jgi:hypothetical protein